MAVKKTSEDVKEASVDVNGMDVQVVPIDDLVLDDRNARKGDVAAVVESLREFGQHRPAVVQRGTNKVIAGNHLVKAARALGWEELSVVFVDDDDLKAQRRSLADNATSDAARWDERMLSELLTEVGAVPGYDDKAMEKLLNKLDKPKVAGEPLFPIVARPNEEYDFVMIVAETEIDAAYLRTKLQLRAEQSYKQDKVATAHIISVKRLQELLEQ